MTAPYYPSPPPLTAFVSGIQEDYTGVFIIYVRGEGGGQIRGERKKFHPLSGGGGVMKGSTL